MPSKAKNNTRSAQKSAKRGNRRRRGPSVPQTFMLVKPASRMTFGYHGLGTLTEAAASTGGLYQFRLNSIYDPDYTGVGTVAQGYTAVTALYGLFRVVRARVIIRLTLNTTGQAIVGFIPSLSPTLTANWQYLESQPMARSKLIQGNVGGGHSVAEWNQVIDLPRVCGLTSSQYQTDMDFAHSTGSNPARSVYLNVFLAGNSAAAQTMIYNVRIVYLTECSQPALTVVS